MSPGLLEAEEDCDHDHVRGHGHGWDFGEDWDDGAPSNWNAIPHGHDGMEVGMGSDAGRPYPGSLPHKNHVLFYAIGTWENEAGLHQRGCTCV